MLLASTTLWRGIASAIAVGAAVVLASVAAAVVNARFEDRYSRYHARKVARYFVFLLLVIALAIIWRAFAGRVGVVLGLLAAGVAFAMQEVIGALAGWFNIMTGHIYRVGDRIQLGGVQGDVLDVSLLRTKILEIGNSTEGEPPAPPGSSWVRGRQPTGRLVTVSNKTTFTEPVFNYSGASFDYVWEELTLPIPYGSDWRAAERILLEEAHSVSDGEGARNAIAKMERDYPMQSAEVEPAVYVTLTDNWVQLAARFVVPVRQARQIKDRMSRRILERFEEVGIRVASSTMEVTVYDGSSEG